VVADYSGDLVEKGLRSRKWSDFRVGIVGVFYKNSVFINISAIFFGLFLVRVGEKIIFV